MRTHLLVLVSAVILLLPMPEGIGQPPSGPSKSGKEKPPKPPPDEEKEILSEIKEAYKAQYEVQEDVLKELRKYYQQPSEAREREIFKELRRLYNMNPDQESAILTEIRRAAERPSPDQEERIFREIDRAERFPAGVVPPALQAIAAKKIFLKFDQDGDGAISNAEMSDSLHSERSRWDTNRDGFLDLEEFWVYYRGRLESLAEQVASGYIDLGMKRGGPMANATPTMMVEMSRPPLSTTQSNGKPQQPPANRGGNQPANQPAKLPDWFLKLDTDGDGQVGLYEWRASRRALDDFANLDRNDDGFITLDEFKLFLAKQAQERPDASARKENTSGKR